VHGVRDGTGPDRPPDTVVVMDEVRSRILAENDAALPDRDARVEHCPGCGGWRYRTRKGPVCKTCSRTPSQRWDAHRGGTPAMDENCEHERMEHAYGDIWRCTNCQHEQEMTAADFGGPDTVWEARGEK
jgi:hypothetical protein